MADWIAQFLQSHGYAVLCIGTIATLLLCGIGLPIPEEVVFLTVGFAAHGIGVTHEQTLLLCAIGVVGILFGDSVPFMLGRRYGMSLLSRPRFANLLTPQRLEMGQQFFRKHGSRTVFCARFLAGVRIPTFFLAATMGVSYPAFLFWDGLGAMISCPASIYLAYYFGDEARIILSKCRVYIFVGLILIAAYSIIRYYMSRTPAVPPPPPGESATASKKADVGQAEVRT